MHNAGQNSYLNCSKKSFFAIELQPDLTYPYTSILDEIADIAKGTG
jgi:hypothetical protein